MHKSSTFTLTCINHQTELFQFCVLQERFKRPSKSGRRWRHLIYFNAICKKLLDEKASAERLA